MSLTGQQVNQSFRSVLNLPIASVLSASLQTVQDGNGTSSPLQLSTLAVNIAGNFSVASIGIDPTGVVDGQILVFDFGSSKFIPGNVSASIDGLLIGGEIF